jgi:hypothetical protein
VGSVDVRVAPAFGPKPGATILLDRCGATMGAVMAGFSIVILICSTALSHSDCQFNTALDVVRGPKVDNVVMCGLNAQTMMARTDLVQADGAQYMKVVCTPSKTVDEWLADVEARKAAIVE